MLFSYIIINNVSIYYIELLLLENIFAYTIKSITFLYISIYLNILIK